MPESGTAFVSGVFNVVHPGHMRLLRFAKELRGTLVVGILSDQLAGSAASVRERDRLEGVRSLRFVDEAFLIEEPLEDVILDLKPDVVVKGREHELGWNLEKDVVDSYGGSLLFGSGEVFVDGEDYLGLDGGIVERAQVRLPMAFMERHGITADRLLGILEDFKQRSVVVVGDVMADEYISCHALGMSQEDPTVVVTPIDSELFLGGAGIVAAHAAGLGSRSALFSVVGADDTAEFIRASLQDCGVETTLIEDANRPTTLKQRYRAAGKTLLRVSHLQQGPIAEQLQQQLGDEVHKQLSNADVLIFSDFNYGCLPQAVVARICSDAQADGIVLAADSQSSSQVGNVARFKGMHLITPTEREARLATRNSDDGLVVLADELRELAQARLVFLTLGGDGVLIRGQDTDEPAITDQVAALNQRPFDVAGAGDSMLVVSALAIACGASGMEAAVLGSVASAIQVSRIGNTPLAIADIQGVLKQ
ncbi:MAG: PfkB family carbohydrate kinase [Actinomycetota bacterium]|nr:PfkB family carbohydrate kinase [Actinomycetota bacterium]